MSSLSGIRDGLRTALATISGLRAYDTIPDNPSPPFAVVVPLGITFDEAFARGLDTYEMSVLVVVGRVSDRIAQDTLDGYCAPSGSGSVKTAIEVDRKLGGACSSLRVTSMRNYQSLTIADATYLAAEFVVDVKAAP